MILTPEYIFKTIECIHPDFLAAHGIKALVLDVDNTLTADNSQVLEHTVQAWLDEMRAAGIRLTIVSNNTAKRVRPFAERIGLDWVPLACKPFTIGLRVARRRLGRAGQVGGAAGGESVAERSGARRPDLCGPDGRRAVRLPVPLPDAPHEPRQEQICAVKAQV